VRSVCQPLKKLQWTQEVEALFIEAVTDLPSPPVLVQAFLDFSACEESHLARRGAFVVALIQRLSMARLSCRKVEIAAFLGFGGNAFRNNIIRLPVVPTTLPKARMHEFYTEDETKRDIWLQFNVKGSCKANLKFVTK
jgi:hypothetical protein